MSDKLIVALAGSSGTGKSTMATHLAEVHGFEVFEGSALIREASAAQGVVLESRESYVRFFREQQVAQGLSWLSDEILSKPYDRILHCGLRSKYDFGNIKGVGGTVIALVCPPEICVERLDKDNPKNPKTPEEYKLHQSLDESGDEFGSHTLWVAQHADFHVDTSGPLEQTQVIIDEIIDHLART